MNNSNIVALRWFSYNKSHECVLESLTVVKLGYMYCSGGKFTEQKLVFLCCDIKLINQLLHLVFNESSTVESIVRLCVFGQMKCYFAQAKNFFYAFEVVT